EQRRLGDRTGRVAAQQTAEGEVHHLAFRVDLVPSEPSLLGTEQIGGEFREDGNQRVRQLEVVLAGTIRERLDGMVDRGPLQRLEGERAFSMEGPGDGIDDLPPEVPERQ